MKQIIKKIFQFILRSQKPLNIASLKNVKPASVIFGLDRGTPIDRYYIEKYISDKSRYIRGRVLEVGDCEYTDKFNSRVQQSDILHAVDDGRTDIIVGDLTNIHTLPKDSYDCFIAVQTLNFIFDLNQAIIGANYLLKPGGVFIGSVSGISQISRYDMERWGDFWRFTDLSIQRLLKSTFDGEINVQTYGNVLSSTAFLRGLVIEDLPNIELLDEGDADYQMTICFSATK